MRGQASFIPGYGRFYRPQDEVRWKIRHMQEIQQTFERGLDSLKRGERSDALFWLQRAERLSGRDDNISFTCAMILLESGAVRQALPRLEALWARYGMREAGLALAGGYLRCGKPEAGRRIMGQVLSRNSMTEAHHTLADSLSFPAGLPGWAVLSNEGTLRLRVTGNAVVGLDGRTVGTVPAGVHDLSRMISEDAGPWWQGQTLTISCVGQPVLGSPIDIQAVIRCQSLVMAEERGVRGWLWYPGEPDFLPSMWIEGHETAFQVEGLAEDFSSSALLQRPRGFSLPYEDWPQLAGKSTSFYDQYGRLLLGAPLDPVLMTLMQHPRPAGSVRKGWTVRGCRMPRKGAKSSTIKKVACHDDEAGCAIIIPVCRDEMMVRACLERVLETVPASCRLIIVDDASPEKGLQDYLAGLARCGRVCLYRHEINRGFVASINTGLTYVPAGWDVILLNSDTLVSGSWVERLLRWIRHEGAGTVTPFSNAGGLTSYPKRDRDNPAPDPADAAELDRMFQLQAQSERPVVALPTANGFCMGISASCLAAVGLLRGEYFAQGYGEENDFCLRASEAGFTHLAAVDVYVLHHAHGSFGTGAAPLLQRNLDILNRLYPGYDAAIQRWKDGDPLKDFRRQLDWRRLRQYRMQFSGAVVSFQHRGGGGVARAVREQAARLARAGILPIILEPTETGCRVVSPVVALDVPNLMFVLPEEQPVLLSFLREMGVQHVIWHHMLGHERGLRTLHRQLNVPYDIYVHDHVWFCPRIALLDEHGRYCGEPSMAGCRACLSRGKLQVDEGMDLPAYLSRSAEELKQARRVVAPSRDAAHRLERHLPDVGLIEIEPLEDDRQIRAGSPPVRSGCPPTEERPLRIVVLGGISRWKGYDVLLALAQHVQKNNLPLRLILIGGTHDDETCLKAGIEVTGSYEDDDVLSLLDMSGADIGFVPSIAPETWCYTLGWLWKAKLAVVGFDIGASAERIRQAGPDWGRVVPLGLPVDRLVKIFLEMGCRDGKRKSEEEGIFCRTH